MKKKKQVFFFTLVFFIPESPRWLMKQEREAEAKRDLEEIGEKFKLTRERVRQIKEKAIRRLRHASRSKQLRAYLG